MTKAYYIEGRWTYQFVSQDMPASYVIVWLFMFGHGASAGEATYWDAVR